MKKPSSENFAQPKNFDIEETVKSSDDKDKMVEQAGEVGEWERLKVEKAQIRPYITGIIISVWVIYIVISMIRLIAVGDPSLLLSSPILFIGPLNTILAFYFKR